MANTARGVLRDADRLVRPAWACVPVFLVAYLWLHMTPGRVALIARQVVFLAPIALAVAALIAVVRVAPQSDERRGWKLLAVSMAVMFASEGFYAGYQVVVSAQGPTTFSVYDLLNLVAAVVIVLALGVAAGVSRLPRPAFLRVASDATAMSVVTYMAFYYAWRSYSAAIGLAWQVSARSAAYTLLGSAIVVGVGWLATGTRGSHDRPIIVLLVASLSVFGVGIALSPLGQIGVSRSDSLLDGLDSAIVLLGYALMVMAALTRLALADRGWRTTMGRSVGTDAAWPSTVISCIVFGACSLMGLWAYRTPDGSGERLLYVAAASTAIIALVARTGFASAEVGLLKDTSTTDPVTGAHNHRAFQEACEERILASRRRNQPFVIAVLDLDGFARVNSLLGHAEGDHALRNVAAALELAGGRSSTVFRLSGDEFAVIGVGVPTVNAVAFATDLLAAIAGVESAPGLRLSASIGVVGCEACTVSRDELLRRVDAAQVWAKYHGKGRIVAYDERIVRALGVEERLRLHREQSYLGMARALAAAADARDPRNYYHSRNVAALCVLMSEAIGSDSARVREIEVAAMLHDVGRIAMPGTMSPGWRSGTADNALEQEHAELGERLVGALGIEGLGSWVRAHHERWDGAGYPDSLKGENIPLEARIIALADAYDGMTTGHRGGAPLSRSAALQEIDHGIGARFDPTLAERFISVVGQTMSLGWSDEWPAA